MASGGFTERGARRACFLEQGPVAVCTAEYTLASGDMIRVPLTRPLAETPASAGRIAITLPWPPGGGTIMQADLLAEDEVAIYQVLWGGYVPDGSTWRAEITGGAVCQP